MKVGILTFHAAYNFGSMLQAYALQTTIEKAGYECKIINLRTKNQKDLYDYKNVYSYEKNPIKKAFKKVFFGNKKNQSKIFERFLANNLKLTDEYTTIGEFEKQGEDFDLFVSGSDQIWNTNATDFNEAYMLTFNKPGKRIAYAVSAGSGKSDFSGYCNELANYAWIGVREIELKKALEKLSFEATVTVDPTLLLAVQEWDKIRNRKMEKTLPKKYILFYSLGYGEEEKKIIAYLKKKFKIPVLAPHRLYTGEVFDGIQLVKNCGPREFVSLFAKASFCFTTSFHGCVFSTIYRREFAAYLPNEGNIDVRKISFLKITGQEFRGIEKLEDVEKLIECPKCKVENQELEDAICMSKKWLKKALSNSREVEETKNA